MYDIESVYEALCQCCSIRVSSIVSELNQSKITEAIIKNNFISSQ